MLTWLALTEDRVDPWWFRWRKRRGWFKKLEVEAYRGYGTSEEIRLRGRVLRFRGIRPPKKERSAWGNFKNMYRRFGTDEIPHARLQAIFQSQVMETVTDDEGYFSFTIKPENPELVEPGWQEFSILMPPQPFLNPEPVAVTAKALILPQGAGFGIISDIDDTLLVTEVRSKARMVQNTLFENALTRRTFPDTPELYRRMHAAPDGTGFNPVFYLSSSPWNLYDFLEKFIQFQRFPEGPLILRDVGLSRKHMLASSHNTHKSAHIRDILTLFENLPFLLFGDSGEKDPYIFAKAVNAFQGRIRHVFIRDVAGKKHSEEMQSLARACRQHGTGFSFFEHIAEVEKIVKAAGWLEDNPQ
ncbi:MAG: App1 family protein [Bacteroidia bacterium]